MVFNRLVVEVQHIHTMESIRCTLEALAVTYLVFYFLRFYSVRLIFNISSWHSVFLLLAQPYNYQFIQNFSNLKKCIYLWCLISDNPPHTFD